MKDTQVQVVGQGEDLRGTCPFCLSVIEVHLDVKGRPYWRCWRCEIRSFGTKTALALLRRDGWIWTVEPPVDLLRAWLKRVAIAAGLERFDIER